MELLNISGSIIILYETMEAILKKKQGRLEPVRSEARLFYFWKQIHPVFPSAGILRVPAPKAGKK